MNRGLGRLCEFSSTLVFYWYSRINLDDFNYLVFKISKIRFSFADEKSNPTAAVPAVECSSQYQATYSRRVIVSRAARIPAFVVDDSITACAETALPIFYCRNADQRSRI